MTVLGWAAPESTTVPVFFVTEPEGMKIYKVRETSLDFLGHSSSRQPLAITLTPYDQQTVRFLVLPPDREVPESLSGQNIQVTPTRQLLELRRVPSYGTIEVSVSFPRRWESVWERHALSLTGIGLLSLVFLGYLGRHARTRRVAQMADRALLSAQSRVSPSRDPVVGSTIGKYMVTGLLGAGGMGTVYRAIELARPEREVALKLGHLHTLGDSEAKARFQNEIAVASRFVHPHIIPVLDFGHHLDMPYLVMPVIEGGTLRDRIADGPLQPDEALQLLAPVFSGLSYAHQKGIVHRDIKLENILLKNVPPGEKEHPLISDFGLAGFAGSGLSPIGGTLNVMSPEQFHGRYSPTSDQYALGVLLFEVLTGQAPFSHDSSVALAYAHLNVAPPRLNEILPSLSSELADLVGKMLSKEPEERYRDLEEALTAFTSAVSSRPGAPSS